MSKYQISLIFKYTTKIIKLDIIIFQYNNKTKIVNLMREIFN